MKLVSRNRSQSRNIFHKVALQSMTRNPTRTLVTIIGVVLSAALFTAVTTFGISLLQYMVKGAIQRYGDWQIAFANADAAFIRQQAQNPQVSKAVSFTELGYAELGTPDIPDTLDIPGTSDKSRLFLAGFTDETFAALPLTLLSGRLPENNQELVLPGKLLTEGGATVAVGDTLSLSLHADAFPLLPSASNPSTAPNQATASAPALTPALTRTYTIVGLCATPDFLPDTIPGYLGITRASPSTEAQTVSLFITLDNLLDVRAYRKAYTGQREYWLNNNVLRFLLLSDSPSDTVFLAMLLSFGVIVMLLIMAGSVLLIYNAFHISLNERTQQIGILASVGATRTQLRHSVLFEGWCIGAIGIPLGVILGLLGIGLIIGLVSARFGSIMYSDVALELVLSPLAIGGAVGLSLVTILLSAYIPARKAASQSVIACIRQTNEIKLEGHPGKPSRSTPFSRLLYGLFGLEGMLARKNFRRNRKRYRSVVFSLVFSVVLFLSASTLITDLQQDAGSLTEFTTHDISFGTEAMADPEFLSLYDEMKAVPGVTGSLYQTVKQARCLVSGRDLVADYWTEARTQPTDEPVALSAKIQFVDEAAYQRLCADSGVSLPESGSRLLTVAKLQRRSTDPTGEMQIDDFRDLFTTPTVEVTLAPLDGSLDDSPDSPPDVNPTGHPEQAQPFQLDVKEVVPPDEPPQLEINGTPVTPTAASNRLYYLTVLVPYSALGTVVPTAPVQAKGMEFRSDYPSQSAAAMERILRERQVSTAYLLLNVSKILEQTRNTIFIAEVFAHTFLVMISLIAVANVFNTISTNMRLRRREIAMLRSVGMSDRSLNKMTRLECLFYGGKALLIGLPLAVLISWQIHRFMMNDGVPFVLPLPSMLISIISVLLIVFVTMAYAVRQIQKENIMDALRDDMT